MLTGEKAIDELRGKVIGVGRVFPEHGFAPFVSIECGCVFRILQSRKQCFVFGASECYCVAHR
jgi:hypothetical protein